MARPDTAGFYYYGPFYGHSKSQIVPGGTDTDPVDNPTTPRDPCDDCPSGYDCEDGKCVSPGQPTVNPNPLDNPTVDTECRLFVSRGSGITTSASGVFSGADANSGGQWTFKCEDSITFYGRLNHSASSGLANDIRWGVGNHVRSFTVPANSIDEQSIFRFTEYCTGEYKIEVKRKNVGSTYYDWQLYQQGKLEEADGETLYVGLSAGAQIWFVSSIARQIEVLYTNSETGNIIRNIPRGEIILTTNAGESITMYDKDIGSNDPYTLGDNYKYGAKVSGGNYEEDWSAGIQSCVPEGFHIPTLSEWTKYINIYNSIAPEWKPERAGMPGTPDGQYYDQNYWLADFPTGGHVLIRIVYWNATDGYQLSYWSTPALPDPDPANWTYNLPIRPFKD